MEEILASIRRIISEDNEAEAPAPDAEHVSEAPVRQEPAPVVARAPEPQPDVLELTEMLDTPPAIPPREVAPPRYEAPRPEPVIPEPPRAQPAYEPPAPAVAQDDDFLASDSAVYASASALASLQAHISRPEPVGAAQYLPLGAVDRTLEDLVRELVKPMLREWLDQNLPPLVDRLVRKEIERVVRRAEV